MAIYDIIIIGAGASGLFCAASFTKKIKGLLLEKNQSPAAKLLLSGSGQCNLTHRGDIRDFASRYGDNGSRIRPILYRLSNQALMDYFQKNGIPLITREDGKVFPKSLSAPQIADFLLARSRENGFSLKTGAPALEIRYAASSRLYTVIHPGGTEQAKHLVIACGGASYPQTGSDGSILPVLSHLAQDQGKKLEIVPQRPALTPVFVQDYPYGSLSGLSFPQIRATLRIKGEQGRLKREIQASGSLLLTHRGFSGPVILDHSRYVSSGDELSINYLPGLFPLDMQQKLKALLSGNHKQAQTVLCQYLNQEGSFFHTGFSRRFTELLCLRCGIDPRAKAASLSGGQLRRFIDLITQDVFRISGTGGFQWAMATAGGVALSQISVKTMECLDFPGLYMIGEVLDVDGDTGGYNLQFAFSSAFTASAGIKL